MVEIFIKYVKSRLKSLPKDDVSRAFLEEELKRADRWKASNQVKVPEALEEEKNVVGAKKKMDKLVAAANRRSRGGCSHHTSEANESIKKREEELCGKQSVTDLLPAKFVLFNSVIKPLARKGIRTKQELIDTPPENFIKFRYVGDLKSQFMIAMRDLAIAEKRAQSPKQLPFSQTIFQGP